MAGDPVAAQQSTIKGQASARAGSADWLDRRVGGGSDQDSADVGSEPDFKPLDAQQAQAWRVRQVVVSPWRVLWLQALVGGVFTALVAVWGSGVQALSVAWGVLAVVLPAAVFARALARHMRLQQAGLALMGLFVWEGVKVTLTVVLLLAAPYAVKNLDWLALLAGFVVTIKVYWLAWMLASRRRPTDRLFELG